MSDNKIYDTLEFDDDIDFDGLDEYEDEHSDNQPADNAEAADESVSDSVATEASEYAASDSEAADIEAAEDENEVEAYAVDVEETAESPIFIPQASESADLTSDKESKSSERFIKRLCAANIAVSAVTLGTLAVGLYFGFNYINAIKSDLDVKNAEVAELEGKNDALEAEYLEAMNMLEKESEEKTEIPENETEQGKIIFYDTSVGYSWVPILTGIERNTYKEENFTVDDRYRMTYTEDGEESSYFGIDVSSYQGEIDWQLVKEDGVEFAFLRIGYRGYGEEGKLCPDEFFVQNYEAAHDAGIDLGIYFFSQASSVEEAVEEAEYVLSLLENRTLEYPIVFDWETIVTGDPEDIPRTEDVMPQTLTLSAIAFCETVKDAGYEAMIYTNKKLATIKYDLRQLSEYPIWLAYYDTELDYCYDFDIWQYGTGQVDGIEGEVDVNIAFIK